VDGSRVEDLGHNLFERHRGATLPRLLPLGWIGFGSHRFKVAFNE